MYCLMLKMRQNRLSQQVVKAELSYHCYCVGLQVNVQSYSFLSITVLEMKV